MAKLGKVQKYKGGPDYTFECPGCGNHHGVWVTERNPLTNGIWSFNGNMDSPTFSPSLLINTTLNGKKHVCHSFVRDGKIQFLSDCTHELAGKTVELPEL